MSDIKEMVNRLRRFALHEYNVNKGEMANMAADALEAMAGEVERITKERDEALRDASNSDAEANHWHDNCIAEQKGPDGYPVFWEWRAKAAEAERDRMKAALVEVEDSLNCRGNPDVAHYCPNCDNSLHKAREIARKALGGDAS